MFDKMLLFLLLILKIQQAKLCKKYPVLKRTDMLDCTKTFTNKIASFESGYYQGKWMYPSTTTVPDVIKVQAASTASVKMDKTYQWFLRDCNVAGKVCLEAMSAEREQYYYWNRGWLTLDTNINHGSNEDRGIQIWCSSCTPERDNITYSDCQIRTFKPWMSGYEMLGVLSPSGVYLIPGVHGTLEMFKWRIMSPQTRQYLEIAATFDNCDRPEDMAASSTITSSLTRTTGTTKSLEVNAKLRLGQEAVQALKLLSVEAGISYSWSSTTTTEAAEGISATVGGGNPGKKVKAGYKWIVKRLVGEAGYTKIKTLYVKDEDVKCT